MATTGASREARRRRIIERGSDRLALITGRIQSLPSDPEQSCSATSLPGQTPAVAYYNDMADSAQREGVASVSSLPNHELDSETSQCHEADQTGEPLPLNSDEGTSILSRETGEPLPLDSDKEKSITSRDVALLGVEEELSQVSSSMRNSTQGQKHEKSLRNSTITSRISSAIVASENIRMFCSVAAAVLVTLSDTRLPILGHWSISNVLLLRPVYLLLLTNVSIVVARLILGTQGAEFGTRMTSGVPSSGENALFNLGNAVESGLLLQKLLGALFIDFSIYVVVLICGLSLLQRSRW